MARQVSGIAAMSKKSCKMLVHQVSAVLPDDRPITAISVVEDVDKCPPNFTVVRDRCVNILNLSLIYIRVQSVVADN